MSQPRILMIYSDYKSPYAYLAKDLVDELAASVPVEVAWRPYVLDIPSYLGSAAIDESGRVLQESRNAHQWRRVRYSYMDCRREATRRGLTIRGPRRIWDSRLAAAGMLHAQRAGAPAFRHYHDTVFDRFWRRELDIEDAGALARILEAAGAPGFARAAGELVAEVGRIGAAAEAQGVFGVPTFVLDGELFWGREHIPALRERLTPNRPEGAGLEAPRSGGRGLKDSGSGDAGAGDAGAGDAGAGDAGAGDAGAGDAGAGDAGAGDAGAGDAGAGDAGAGDAGAGAGAAGVGAGGSRS